MENSTKIKAVLYAILASQLGGDEALTDAWRDFVGWAFANLQADDVGGFKIAALAGLGLYLFWRKRTGQVALSSAAREAVQQMMRDMHARREPAAPPENAAPKTEPKTETATEKGETKT